MVVEGLRSLLYAMLVVVLKAAGSAAASSRPPVSTICVGAFQPFMVYDVTTPDGAVTDSGVPKALWLAKVVVSGERSDDER